MSFFSPKSAPSSSTECPICFERFPKSMLERHAASCDGPTEKPVVVVVDDADVTPPKKRKGNDGVPEAKSAASAAKPVTSAAAPTAPLAEQMRPCGLEDLVGQEASLGPWLSVLGRPAHLLPSLVLWGPPGCGKTSIANIIATKCKKDSTEGDASTATRFVRMSACTSGVADVKEAVKAAKNELRMFKRKTILFIDEVHRFNKAQQDAFLPHVEDGTITLLGATTENPSFSLNSALLSRCRVVPLSKLSQDSVLSILQRAVSAATSHVDGVRVDHDALKYLAGVADGDARTALNCLQIAAESGRDKGVVTLEDAKASLMRSHVLYDRNGDEHFHCISAMHKSIRGSDANAALYWTMRMLAGGEDPVYVARRLVRAASEDVGLADPQALPLAVSAMQGCQLLGKPECNVLLAQCSVYLARAKKSHEIMDAMSNVLETMQDASANLPPVPLHLRNATSKLASQMGYAKGYTHDLAVTHNLQYMPQGMENVDFFKSDD